MEGICLLLLRYIEMQPDVHRQVCRVDRAPRKREGAIYEVVVITGFAEHIMLAGKQSGHVVCMTAVRFMLIHCGVNIEFFKNPMVMATRAAMEKAARKKEIEEGKGDKRWPATTAFVTTLSKKLASWQC